MNEPRPDTHSDPDPGIDDEPESGQPAEPSRVTRFVRTYGWRAYAVPVLAVLTLAALITVVVRERSSSDPHTAAGMSATTAAKASSASAPASASSATSVPGEPTAAYTTAGDGTLNILPGTSAVLGTGGPVKTYVIEYEGGINADPAEFASYVGATLADPRSWGAGGQMSFQQVDGSTPFDFRVALVSPDHVDSVCPGLETEGYTSCRFGDRAVINLARWSVGVPFYDGHLVDYRNYVINHEVGHYLGHDHEQCAGPGLLAPVMQQQTLEMAGCLINPWPYPHAPTDNPANPN